MSTIRIHPALLHEIFPSGPFWTLVGSILLAVAVTVVLYPLVFLRRRRGGRALVYGWLVESVLLGMLLPNHDPVNLIRALLTLLLPVAIIHVRATRWPNGRKLVDIAAAGPFLWFGTVLALFSMM